MQDSLEWMRMSKSRQYMEKKDRLLRRNKQCNINILE